MGETHAGHRHGRAQSAAPHGAGGCGRAGLGVLRRWRYVPLLGGMRQDSWQQVP
jgi:hypothetical protein